jgi:prevent-host-death family protein
MKTISVSELKTHLSREIRKVEKGSSVLITDHDHPVALLTSVKENELEWLHLAEKPMKTIRLNHKVIVKTDPLEILLEDRIR